MTLHCPKCGHRFSVENDEESHANATICPRCQTSVPLRRSKSEGPGPDLEATLAFAASTNPASSVASDRSDLRDAVTLADTDPPPWIPASATDLTTTSAQSDDPPPDS